MVTAHHQCEIWLVGHRLWSTLQFCGSMANSKSHTAPILVQQQRVPCVVLLNTHNVQKTSTKRMRKAFRTARNNTLANKHPALFLPFVFLRCAPSFDSSLKKTPTTSPPPPTATTTTNLNLDRDARGKKLQARNTWKTRTLSTCCHWMFENDKKNSVLLKSPLLYIH